MAAKLRRLALLLIAMSPAGLCFTDDFFFFFELPLPSFDNGCTDLNEDCCINTVDEKIPTAKI